MYEVGLYGHGIFIFNALNLSYCPVRGNLGEEVAPKQLFPCFPSTRCVPFVGLSLGQLSHHFIGFGRVVTGKTPNLYLPAVFVAATLALPGPPLSRRDIEPS